MPVRQPTEQRLVRHTWLVVFTSSPSDFTIHLSNAPLQEMTLNCLPNWAFTSRKARKPESLYLSTGTTFKSTAQHNTTKPCTHPEAEYTTRSAILSAADAKTLSGMEEYPNVDNQILWDRAYDLVKEKDGKLVTNYEKLLGMGICIVQSTTYFKYSFTNRA